MAVKRVSSMYKAQCICCNDKINITNNMDNGIYSCNRCGKNQFIDINIMCKTVTITDVAHKELRKRNFMSVKEIEEAQRVKQNRKQLIERAEQKEKARKEELANYMKWIDELIEMEQPERNREFAYMGREMSERVKKEIEIRVKERAENGR